MLLRDFHSVLRPVVAVAELQSSESTSCPEITVEISEDSALSDLLLHFSAILPEVRHVVDDQA